MNTTESCLPVRGVMLDPARLTEKLASYRTLLPLLAEWGYNTLFWHFTDDRWTASQGCALRFPSHPKLAGQFAFSVEQTAGLVQLAAQHGLQVIPEVECFGHTGYIRAQYPHLADGVAGNEFGALAPGLPETRRILEALLTDAARIFPAPYVHVGLDEAAFGDHPHTRALLARGARKWELLAAHIRWLHSVVTRKLGKTMLMWGDHLLTGDNGGGLPDYVDKECYSAEIADTIPNDIVICDWHYKPAPDFPSLDVFLARGFRVIACAATCSYGALYHPARWNLDNVRDFTAAAVRRANNPLVLGAMNCLWVPQRCLSGTYLPLLAFGGACQRAGAPRATWLAAFMRDTYGLAPDQARRAARAVQLLLDAAPHRDEWLRALPTCADDAGKATAATAAAMRRMGQAGTRAWPMLRAARRGVRRHHAWFDDGVFTARCFAELAARFAAVKQLAARAPRMRSAARARALHTLRRQAETLAREGRRLWSAHRYAADYACDGSSLPGACNTLHEHLAHSARFLRECAREPSLLLRWFPPAH